MSAELLERGLSFILSQAIYGICQRSTRQRKSFLLGIKADDFTWSAVCVSSLNVESTYDKEEKILNVSRSAHTGGKAAEKRLVRKKYLNLTLFHSS